MFAHGSLMWDPAIDFAEVRRAWLPGHARRFILCDIHGARGTRDAPGLMAALDRGDGCFLADHESDMIRGDLSRDEQVRYAATGTGFLDCSHDYLENIARKFAAFGI